MTSRLRCISITALIPCYNEEKGIGAVLASFPHEKLSSHGFDLEVIVIDNNSKDKTAEIARAYGAMVIHEPRKGKGNAMRRGFFAIAPDTDYVVMLDGDCAFRGCAPETRIWWGAYLGTPAELLEAGTVGEVGAHIVAVRAQARERHGWIMDTYLLRPPEDARPR